MDGPAVTQQLRPPRRTLEERLAVPGEPAAAPSRRHRRLARLASAVLEPVWYWLDLFGPDDHPSNTKVLATAAILTGLAIILALAIGMAIKGTSPDEWYVFLVLGIVGGAAGWDSVKTIAKMRRASRAPPA